MDLSEIKFDNYSSGDFLSGDFLSGDFLSDDCIANYISSDDGNVNPLPYGWEVNLADNVETATEHNFYWVKDKYDKLFSKYEKTGNEGTIVNRISRTLQEIWRYYYVDSKGNILLDTNRPPRDPISLDKFPPNMPLAIVLLFLPYKQQKAIAGKQQKAIAGKQQKEIAGKQQKAIAGRQQKEIAGKKQKAIAGKKRKSSLLEGEDGNKRQESLEERQEKEKERQEKERQEEERLEAERERMKKERKILEAERERIKEEKKRKREKQRMMRTFINDIFNKIARAKNSARYGFSAHPDDNVCNADNIYTYLLKLSTESDGNPNDNIANYLQECEDLTAAYENINVLIKVDV
jgi:hypothetical protein